MMYFTSLTLLQNATALSSVERDGNKNQILLVDGVSVRLADKTPKKENHFIEIGAYKEYFFSESHALFKQASPGILLSFQQKLWRFWRGSVEARWSHWTTQKENTPKYMMPLGLFSKIAAQPEFKFFDMTFSPYVTAGIGYTILFRGNSYFNLRVPEGFGEASAIAGGGLQVIIVKSFGINLGFDAWKGLESTEYFIGALSLGLVTQF